MKLVRFLMKLNNETISIELKNGTTVHGTIKVEETPGVKPKKPTAGRLVRRGWGRGHKRGRGRGC